MIKEALSNFLVWFDQMYIRLVCRQSGGHIPVKKNAKQIYCGRCGKVLKEL